MAVFSNKDDFIYQSMLTCIGNKRKLVKNIYDIVSNIAERLGKEKLNILDGFAGSVVVSRQLSYIADTLHTNDLEYYSFLMASCYLKTPTIDQQERIKFHIDEMNKISKEGRCEEGFISKLYAPILSPLC